MRWLGAALLTLILLGPMATSAHSQTREPVVMQPRVLSPQEYLLNDSSKVGGRTSLPGEVTEGYTPEQDTVFAHELAARVSAHARFLYHTHELSEALSTMQALQRPPSIWENINRTMSIPAALLAPSPQEITQHQVNIARAMYVPGVLMFPMGTGNLQVSFGDIARVFGLEEDVTPRIRYVIDQTTEVTVVIYAASAVAVNVIFNGIQSPGAYELIWDGLMENNKPAPKGDYVAEVQLGDQRVMRKRIVWPPAR